MGDVRDKIFAYHDEISGGWIWERRGHDAELIERSRHVWRDQKEAAKAANLEARLHAGRVVPGTPDEYDFKRAQRRGQPD
jgi:alkanesulfonate monooxygenase SsuD/methylene tetrahydromethanopterin reductase-like flavin-dependent oxidoreductase (luciferase family)